MLLLPLQLPRIGLHQTGHEEVIQVLNNGEGMMASPMTKEYLLLSMSPRSGELWKMQTSWVWDADSEDVGDVSLVVDNAL